MKLIIFLILLFCLGLSLLLNYTFYKKAFIPLHATKLDPIGLTYYPQQSNIPQKESSVSILFYGDSRALHWPYPIVNQSIPHQFINRSIGNQTSIQITQRFKHHVAPLKPDIIVIQMGVNDLKMIPLFPQKKTIIIQTCKNNIKTVLKQAHALSANVILTTIFPLGSVNIDRQILGIKEQPIIEAINEVNQYIHSLEGSKTVIFDSYQQLKGKGQTIDKHYSQDWLHLNPKGYQKLNKTLKGILEQVALRVINSNTPSSFYAR